VASRRSRQRRPRFSRYELKRQEREAIINALIQANGKVSGTGGAAELLGMKRSTLESRISPMSINRKALDSAALE
jgi:transcriptional regulator with GAF, ATPase, and Fis domain